LKDTSSLDDHYTEILAKCVPALHRREVKC
jgi:hypothetical protein